MQVIGIDLAQDKFDVNFINEKGKEVQKEIKNRLSAISKFLMHIPANVVLVAEHTGPYGDLLVYLCNQLNVPIALVPGYTIKHSFGMQKGKDDQVDAKRVREYGERFTDRLVWEEYKSESMAELNELFSLRNLIVKARKSLKNNEHARSRLPMQSTCAHKHTNELQNTYCEKIVELEMEMETIIRMDSELNEIYELAISITGIGPVIATDLIIKTGNFKSIDTARKAASYTGVCPFPNASGKMVKKSKTSPFADKKLKTLLHMGCKAAVRHNMQFKLYYEKKKMEGKPHYLIMNNVANKILRTVYSVVKNKTPYSKDYICHDPREKNNIISSKIVA